MDTGTIIVTLIFLVIVIVPFFIFGKTYRKQKKQLLLSLKQEAEKQRAQLRGTEVAGKFGIAIDEAADILFFARLNGSEYSARALVLSDYNRCRMNTKRSFAEEGESAVTGIELVFYAVEKGSPDVVLNLFDADNDAVTLSDELQVAVKWSQILERRFKDNKKKPTRQITRSQAG